jgi:ABC-type transport system involved in cytochrome bd biosynthesis fused ATPase/permease subunit
MSFMRQVRNGWLERPRADFLVAALVTAVHVAVVLRTGHGDILGWADNERRSQLYQTTASTAALVSAFAAIATQQWRGASGRRATAVRANDTRRALRRSLRSALVVPLLLAGVSLVVLALDTTEKDAGGVRFIFAFVFVLGVIVVARLATLFQALDAIDELDQEEDQELGPAAEVAIPDEDMEPAPSRRPAPRTRATLSASGAGGHAVR